MAVTTSHHAARQVFRSAGDPNESALENCQVQAARVAPISAIPGRRRAQLAKGVRLRKWVRLVWRDWLTCGVDGWAAAATCCLLLLRQELGGGLDGVADR